MKGKTSRLTFEMPSSFHKKLKAIAAMNGITLKELILTCIEENILSKHDLPKSTKKQ
jgi:predicted DNA-binding ribbon-helix-helix protein